ncbi:hypothetical protein [Sphingobium lactosutens]|jgi:hypothetical protein|uniref:hypothetical protein n=1 Tax=Sphingobium lactosutens TaxID=522773 RepID=UPI001D19299B|nr:hypothetical protein [Sphingobium lactosutens]MCC4256990.1 hypothetical protein [Sphingobium lactosutens]
MRSTPENIAPKVDAILREYRLTVKARNAISTAYATAWEKLLHICDKRHGLDVTVRQDTLTPSIFVITLDDESKDLFMNFWEDMAWQSVDTSQFGKSVTQKELQKAMNALGCLWSELVFDRCAVKQWADKNGYAYEALTADGWIVGRIRLDDAKAISYAKIAGQFRAEKEAA